MTIKNLTPHPVTICTQQGKVIFTFPACAKPARLDVKTESGKSILFEGFEVPISKTVFGNPVNLPNPEKGVYLIVSQIIKNAYPNRKDLLLPAQVVRDSNNNIIGCQSLGI
jgi:hypothetical protein